MDKKNYRESLENDRQEIIAGSGSNPSRRTQRQTGKQQPPKGKNLLMPVLFFIFILIPVTILIYVAFIYEPDDTMITSQNENKVSVENTSPSENSPVIIPEELEEEAADEVVEADEDQSVESEMPKEEEPEEVSKEEIPEVVTEPEIIEPPVVQEAPAPEVPTTETVEEPASADNNSGKTVIVQENETLYRIAVNNYGSSGAGAAVEKIKQANGLNSNEIQPGQKLILP